MKYSLKEVKIFSYEEVYLSHRRKTEKYLSCYAHTERLVVVQLFGRCNVLYGSSGELEACHAVSSETMSP
jgi:hypothetical protein